MHGRQGKPRSCGDAAAARAANEKPGIRKDYRALINLRSSVF